LERIFFNDLEFINTHIYKYSYLHQIQDYIENQSFKERKQLFKHR